MIPEYSLPPINPAAFGGLPQGPEGGPPSASPPLGGPQGQPQLDAQKYLMDKVAEIRQRMGAGNMGALNSISSAMQPAQPQPQPQMKEMSA